MTSVEIDLGRPRYGLSRHLHGTCLEIGPGISPFPTPIGTTRILAERPFEGSIVDLFPELGPVAIAPTGDIYLDLDTDGLRQFAAGSLGSVIVSHVLEHVANPIQALVEIHRVLEFGGTALIALPDRRFTFDKDREATTVSHCYAEFREGVTQVSDDHIIEFCRVVEQRSASDITPELIEHHRKRSIHVHCWDAEEFLALVIFLLSQGLVSFSLVDFMGIEQSKNGRDDEEFVFVLRKEPAAITVDRLLEQWVDCVTSNQQLDTRRIIHLSQVLVSSTMMMAPEGLTGTGSVVSGAQLLELWLTNRDLRQFVCPLVDPEPLQTWAESERGRDSRLMAMIMRGPDA